MKFQILNFQAVKREPVVNVPSEDVVNSCQALATECRVANIIVTYAGTLMTEAHEAGLAANELEDIADNTLLKHMVQQLTLSCGNIAKLMVTVRDALLLVMHLPDVFGADVPDQIKEIYDQVRRDAGYAQADRLVEEQTVFDAKFFAQPHHKVLKNVLLRVSGATDMLSAQIHEAQALIDTINVYVSGVGNNVRVIR